MSAVYGHRCIGKYHVSHLLSDAWRYANITCMPLKWCTARKVDEMSNFAACPIVFTH